MYTAGQTSYKACKRTNQRSGQDWVGPDKLKKVVPANHQQLGFSHCSHRSRTRFFVEQCDLPETVPRRHHCQNHFFPIIAAEKYFNPSADDRIEGICRIPFADDQCATLERLKYRVLGNLLKIAGFTLIGFSFAEYGLTMLCMVPAAVIGTRVGKAVLSNMDERYFLIAFRIVLVALALKLIVWDGLARI